MKRLSALLIVVGLLLILASSVFAQDATGSLREATETGGVLAVILGLVPMVVGYLKSKEYVTNDNAGMASVVVGVVLVVGANYLGLFEPPLSIIQAVLYGIGDGLAGTGLYSLASKTNAKRDRTPK